MAGANQRHQENGKTARRKLSPATVSTPLVPCESAMMTRSFHLPPIAYKESPTACNFSAQPSSRTLISSFFDILLTLRLVVTFCKLLDFGK